MNFYSDFDDESERVSNATDIRPSLASANKSKKVKPNVIKGFCSSISSSKSQIEEPAVHDHKTDMKYNFYNSGTGFYNSEGNFTSPVKFTSKLRPKMSEKRIERVGRLSIDLGRGEANKTLGYDEPL